MNQTNRIAGYACTAILVLATFAVYFLGLGSMWDRSVCKVSLIFILLSEIIFCGAAIFTKKTILKIGLITLSALYWIATVGVAAIFLMFFINRTLTYTLINVLLIAVAAIVGILLHTSAVHIEKTQDNY